MTTRTGSTGAAGGPAVCNEEEGGEGRKKGGAAAAFAPPIGKKTGAAQCCWTMLTPSLAGKLKACLRTRPDLLPPTRVSLRAHVRALSLSARLIPFAPPFRCLRFFYSRDVV